MKNKANYLTAREWLATIGEYIIIILLISYLFYDSYFSPLLFAPLIYPFIVWKQNKKYKEKRDELESEFLKSLQSVATSLAAGYSPENAFVEAKNDMEKMYGKKSVIVKELDIINGKVYAGGRLEDALFDFSQKTESEYIEDFALIFSVAKAGGDGLSATISNCIDIMQQARATQEEIKVLIRGKQYEQRIMEIVPLGIIAYLKLSSGSFIMVLYHNLLGIIIMTGCLLAYILSVIISEKICSIEI